MKKYLFFCLLLSIFTTIWAQQSGVNLRRNIMTYSQIEMDELTDAIIAMKDTARKSLYDPAMNAYDYFVDLHYFANTDHFSNAHHSPGFMAWHREFLLRFEAEWQKSTNNLHYRVPYWDWTDASSINVIFNTNSFGSNGNPNDNFIVQDSKFGKVQGLYPIRVRQFEGLLPDTAAAGRPYLKRHMHFITHNPLLSIAKSNLNKGSLSVSPNPTNGLLKIALHLPTQGNYRLSVVNYLGEIVMPEASNFYRLDKIKTLNIAHFPAGMYLLQVENELYQMSTPIVKY